MILGIDPKNDFAFKCVFGSERHTEILVDMLNAVLMPGADRRVKSVEVLNPIVEPVVLDEKLSILDIKARDQSGRHFELEMQTVAHPSFARRFLYHWAKRYSGQLVAWDQHERRGPAIAFHRVVVFVSWFVRLQGRVFGCKQRRSPSAPETAYHLSLVTRTSHHASGRQQSRGNNGKPRRGGPKTR